MMKRILESDLFTYLLIVTIVVLTYSNIIFFNPTVSPDAPYILLYMEELKSLSEYFQKLFTLTGIDFQPVRDLSLLIDLLIYRKTGINFFIFTNCLVWAGICYQVFKLSLLNSTDDRKKFSFILVILFSVHPLFSQTINWSMGRKHLLAAFFILWTTRKFLDAINNKGSGRWVPVLYGVSLLSVPVSLLWPIWASLTGFLTLSREKLKELLIRLIPLYALMLIVGVINYAFYFTSSTYKEIYIQKSGSIEFAQVFYHIGQHFKQMLFPFFLRFHYRLDQTALWFFGALVLGTVFLQWKKRNDPTIWHWFSFSIISMLLFLRTPDVYYDTYVILPAVGFFLMGIRLLPSLKPLHLLSVAIIPVLASITFMGNPVWKSLRTFTENNFRFNQDCHPARNYGETFYTVKQKLPNDLYEFIQRNNCLQPLEGESPVGIRGIRNLESRMLLTEDEIEFEYRKKRLEELSEENFYPKIALSLFMARAEEKEETERIMTELNSAFAQIAAPLDYDPIITDELKSYCEREKLSECLIFSKRFSAKISQPFY